MSIWNVSNLKLKENEITIEKEIRLWRNEPGNFLVIEQGKYLPMLTGDIGYTLIKKEYSPVFKTIEQIHIIPAVIFDRVRQAENFNYVEIILSRKISPDAITTEDSSGKKVWSYKGSLFISDEVKYLLENIPGNELQFHPGFQFWG